MAKPKPKVPYQVTSIRFPEDMKQQLEEIGLTEHWSFNQTVLEAMKHFIKSKQNPS